MTKVCEAKLNLNLSLDSESRKKIETFISSEGHEIIDVLYNSEEKSLRIQFYGPKDMTEEEMVELLKKAVGAAYVEHVKKTISGAFKK